MFRICLGAGIVFCLFVCLLKIVRHGLCSQCVHRLVLFAVPVIVCIECYNQGMKIGEDDLGGIEEEVAFQQGLARGWGFNRVEESTAQK